MKKFLLIMMLLWGGGAAGFWYWNGSHGERVSFRTVPIRQGDLKASITATGTVEPEEVVDVGAQVAGAIQSFGADPRSEQADQLWLPCGARDGAGKARGCPFQSPCRPVSGRLGPRRGRCGAGRGEAEANRSRTRSRPQVAESRSGCRSRVRHVPGQPRSGAGAAWLCPRAAWRWREPTWRRPRSTWATPRSDPL